MSVDVCAIDKLWIASVLVLKRRRRIYIEIAGLATSRGSAVALNNITPLGAQPM